MHLSLKVLKKILIIHSLHFENVALIQFFFVKGLNL